MIIQKGKRNIINILICFMLVVCALYHEPVVVPENPCHDPVAKVLSFVSTITAPESEPEVFTDKAEQAVSASIRNLTSRYSYGRYHLDTKGGFFTSLGVFSLSFYTTALIIHFCIGLDTLFKMMILYIWSQIGL